MNTILDRRIVYKFIHNKNYYPEYNLLCRGLERERKRRRGKKERRKKRRRKGGRKKERF